MSDSVQPHRRQSTRLPHPWDSSGKNTGVGCHFLLQCMKVKCESEVAQSCLTLSHPMDCSPPGSSAHGIFQAGVLEWGAIAFSALHCHYYCWHFGSALAYDAPCTFPVASHPDAGVCARAQRAWLPWGAEAALLRHQGGLEGPRRHTRAARRGTPAAGPAAQLCSGRREQLTEGCWRWGR